MCRRSHAGPRAGATICNLGHPHQPMGRRLMKLTAVPTGAPMCCACPCALSLSSRPRAHAAVLAYMQQRTCACRSVSASARAPPHPAHLWSFPSRVMDSLLMRTMAPGLLPLHHTVVHSMHAECVALGCMARAMERACKHTPTQAGMYACPQHMHIHPHPRTHPPTHACTHKHHPHSHAPSPTSAPTPHPCTHQLSNTSTSVSSAMMASTALLPFCHSKASLVS